MARDSYTHATTDGPKGGPLVFTFHGTGGNEHQFHALASELVPDATVISPRGDVSEHGAARFFRRTAEGVYDMPDLAARTDAMAAFLQPHIDAVAPAKAIGLGYSNGANILAFVLFAKPDMFDAAVLMHPLIPFTPPAAPIHTRVLITAGRRDPICPPDLTQALADYFGAQLDWHDGGHEIRQTEIAAIQAFFTTGAT